MKLYIHPLSSNARRPRLVAHHLGLAVEEVFVDISKGEQRQPAYLALNPSGKVPTLVDGDLKLTEARIGEPAGPATGMFLTIDNTGDQPDTLVAVTTKVSPEVQLHETIKDGDSTAMKELPGGVQVPAQASVIRKPGGTHAMMMKVDRLAAGDEVPVTLTFKNAGDVEMDVLVVPLAELGGDGHMDDTDKGDDADAHSDG